MAYFLTTPKFANNIATFRKVNDIKKAIRPTNWQYGYKNLEWNLYYFITTKLII
ncbi:MAG TPA: hypothetical protein PK762_00230 [Candidatus Kapabacteria bacterium]|nr:hypothetical protein [Candidatus Kapabacteria bacterium]